MGFFSKKRPAVAIRLDLLLDTSEWAYRNRRALFLHALMLAMSEVNDWGERQLTTSYDKLAKLMVCSKSQVRHTVELLVDHDYIKRVSINTNRKNQYESTTYEITENNAVKLTKVKNQ